MKFYYRDKNGHHTQLTEEEARKHLTQEQITEAIAAKRADPLEEVGYMADGGFIICEL